MPFISIDKKECSSLHFTGICGTGMSAIAQYLRWQELEITGSDRLCDAQSGQDAVKRSLEAAKCRIYPQDGSGIGSSTSAVVVSTAIEQSNPDIAAAGRMGIPVFHRSDVLAAIVRTKKTIAVAGTSGKSTVSAMIFHILQYAGMNPSVICGANLHSIAKSGLVGNAFSGTSPLLVIEADESDGSLVKYHPEISLFLNISKDHKNIEETLELFQTLAAQSAFVIKNNDDPKLSVISSPFRFGTSEGAEFRGAVSGNSHSAMVTVGGKTFSSGFPGRHTAMNMLAAMSVCTRIGVSDEAMAEALMTYTGIERRFDRINTAAGVTVIDDYAHNPEKIRAAILTARELSTRVISLFQPHGFGPTRFMFEELVSVFSETLRKSDTLMLLPIYFAGGTAKKDISSRDIANRLAGCGGEICVFDERSKAVRAVADRAKKGDIVISMGARDPSLPAFAKSIAKAIDSAVWK